MTNIDVSGLPEPVIRDIRRLVETLRGNLTGPEAKAPPAPRTPLAGRLANRGLVVPTLAEFETARRELGEGFPRDFPNTEES